MSTIVSPRWSRMAGVASLAGALLLACNERAPKAGAPCTGSANVPSSSCSDPAHVLACRAFTWHLESCRGPSGCTAGRCDQRVAEDGDTCDTVEARACSADQKRLLRCDGWKMSATQTCRGERGCYRATPDSEPACDRGNAEVGDACESSSGMMESRCGTDEKAILQCDPSSHRFVLARNCLGPKGCFDFSAEASPDYLRRVGANKAFRYLACDVSVGDVGEPCWGYVGVGIPGSGSAIFCSSDRKAELTCNKDGALVSRTRCSCTTQWSREYGSWEIGCEGAEKRWSPPFLTLGERL